MLTRAPSTALLALALSFAVMSACTEEGGGHPGASPLPHGEPGVAPGEPEAVTATRAMDLVAPPSPAAATTPVPSLPPAIDTTPCAPWMGRPRCTIGEHVLASAQVRGIADANLARTTAGNRARAALFGGEGGQAGSDLVKVEACKDATWALVRAKTTDVGGAELPACTFAAE